VTYRGIPGDDPLTNVAEIATVIDRSVFPNSQFGQQAGVAAVRCLMQVAQAIGASGTINNFPDYLVGTCHPDNRYVADALTTAGFSLVDGGVPATFRKQTITKLLFQVNLKELEAPAPAPEAE
jgi:hypothetical protein